MIIHIIASELAEEIPDCLILPAVSLPRICWVRSVRAIEGAKFDGIPGLAALHASADVITTRNLCRSHPVAVINRGIVMA